MGAPTGRGRWLLVLALAGPACSAVEGPGTGAGATAGGGSSRVAILAGVEPEGLRFAPAAPRDAGALAACATGFAHQGLGQVQGAILAAHAPPARHYAAVTDRHVLLFTAATCAAHAAPMVLADVVTDGATRAQLARQVAATGATAVAEAPAFRFAPSDLTLPLDQRDLYFVPIIGGAVQQVHLPSRHPSMIVQGFGRAAIGLAAVVLLAVIAGGVIIYNNSSPHECSGTALSTPDTDPAHRAAISLNTTSAQQVEPSLAADGRGTLVASWTGESPGSPTRRVVQYGLSRDGGASWPVRGTLQGPAATGGDSAVAADAAGNFYLVWLATQGGHRVYVARLAASEERFGCAVEASDPASKSDLDKPWITVGNRGEVLAVWIDRPNGLVFAKSTDGANSFVRTTAAADDWATAGCPFLCLDHTAGAGAPLYIVHAGESEATGETGQGAIHILKSTDGGAHWSNPINPTAYPYPIGVNRSLGAAVL